MNRIMGAALVLAMAYAGPGAVWPAANAREPARRVDINSCSYTELLHLPGIGPRLADAILDEFGVRGDFKGPADLLRVKGIGKPLADRLARHVTFSSSPPVEATSEPAKAGVPEVPIALNSATLQQLETLPGVGPRIAARIIEYRTRHGGFRSAAELAHVRGLGPRRAEALLERVRAP